LGEQLGISDEVAAKLTLFGGVSAEMIVDMPVEFLTSSLELSTEEAEAILERARSIASGEAATK
jgi:hypothetical protein